MAGSYKCDSQQYDKDLTEDKEHRIIESVHQSDVQDKPGCAQVETMLELPLHFQCKHLERKVEQIRVEMIPRNKTFMTDTKRQTVYHESENTKTSEICHAQQTDSNGNGNSDTNEKGIVMPSSSSRYLSKQRCEEMAKLRKIAIKLATYVSVFIICWTPLEVISCLSLLGVSAPGQLYNAAAIILSLNSLINPLMYQVFQKRHKKACPLLRIFTKDCSVRK
ncbi:hypothetical protein BSL78_12422 [Apostichopus japonicus]|uniref:G-protein coupled receptors family 1 profile domain-containing protein n=1 Tax=Stichopus japonicus TaxID=307972 RepID=A0A2G8KRQ1_STIJA|nr:hypothetical protein BSL78_12422 [Apostichopus japonicus]